MPMPTYISQTEQDIAREIIRRALAKGWTVSVNDGEEWVVRSSDNQEIIENHMGSTDSDTLRFRAQGISVGTMLLIWGNGRDLISDTSVAEDDVYDAFANDLMQWAGLHF